MREAALVSAAKKLREVAARVFSEAQSKEGGDIFAAQILYTKLEQLEVEYLEVMSELNSLRETPPKFEEIWYEWRE